MQGEFHQFDRALTDGLDLEEAIGSLSGVGLFDYLIETDTGLSRSRLISTALRSESSVRGATALFILEVASPEIIASHAEDLLAFVEGSSATSENLKHVLELLCRSDAPAARKAYQSSVVDILSRGGRGGIHLALSHGEAHPELLSAGQLIECSLAALRAQPGGVEEDLLREQVVRLLRGEERDQACAVLEEMILSSRYNPETTAFAAGNLFTFSPQRSVQFLIGMMTHKLNEEEVADFTSYNLLPNRFEEGVKAGVEYAEREVCDELFRVVGDPSRTFEERFLATRALASSRHLVGEKIDMLIYHLGEERQPGDDLFKGALMHTISLTFAAVERRGRLRKMLFPYLQSKDAHLACQACDCIGRLWDNQRGDRGVVTPLARLLLSKHDAIVEHAIVALKRATPESHKDVVRLVVELVKSQRHKELIRDWLA